MWRVIAFSLLAFGLADSASRSIRVVQTAKGTTDKLTPKADVPFASGESGIGLEVHIDSATAYQTMIGFGGAFTESAAKNMVELNTSHPQKYNEIMEAYFGKDGLSYTFGRIPMGSCDFSPYTPSWSYADTKDDFDMTHFSMKNDEERRLPWIRDALARVNAAGRDLKIFGSPWSAPGWMKKNGPGSGAMICGLKSLLTNCTLKEDTKYHEAFARYMARWANEYERALGQKVWGITVTNEPQENVLTYEGMVLTPWTERDLIKNYLGPIMEKEAPGVRIMILDHNKDKLEQWADTILGDTEAAKYVWGSAVHWYTGDHFDALARVHEKYPNFQILATEATESREGIGLPGSGAAMYKKNGTWSKGEHYAHDMIGDFNNWVTGFVDWNLALDMNGGPLHINVAVIDIFGSDSAVIVDAAQGGVYYQTIFQYIGHFSKFVPEGSKRIAWNVHNAKLPDHCSTILTEQKSSKQCVEGVNYACMPGTGKMWVSDGCRGTFTCDGVEGIQQHAMGHQNRTLTCIDVDSIEVTAFKSGSDVVVVALNTNDKTVDYSIVDQGQSAQLSLPPHSIQTLTYPASAEELLV